MFRLGQEKLPKKDGLDWAKRDSRPKKEVKERFDLTRFWVIASSASFSLREFSTKRFPTTESRINVMSESTCKKYKNTNTSTSTNKKYTDSKIILACFEEFMRGLKNSQENAAELQNIVTMKHSP